MLPLHKERYQALMPTISLQQRTACVSGEPCVNGLKRSRKINDIPRIAHKATVRLSEYDPSACSYNQCRSLIKRMQHGRLHVTKSLFAKSGKDIGDAFPGIFNDERIQIDKPATQAFSKQLAHGGFAGSHESCQIYSDHQNERRYSM